MSKSHVQEEKRDDAFCDKIQTAIWKESPADSNPYQVAEARCHGYEHLALTNNTRFSDMFFLMFRGELPNTAQSVLFERLLISVIHPGPRHNATRAAMNAAVSRTQVSNILPLALNVFSGEWQGSREVQKSMKFLQRYMEQPADEVAEQHLKTLTDAESPEGDRQTVAGFGTLYGTADAYAQTLADNLAQHCEVGACFRWASAYVDKINAADCGWRTTGLFAAVMVDLGFSAFEGEFVFQIASAPGIAAQAAEKVGQPLTAMPFLKDKNYIIERD